MTEDSKKNRRHVVKTTLKNQLDDDIIRAATPGERMEMVWQLTLDAWAFLDPERAESEFQRHVVRIKRGKS